MLSYLMQWIKTYVVVDEKGQDLVEYAVLVVFIAIVVIAAATFLGEGIGTVFSNIANALGAEFGNGNGTS